MSNFMPMTLLYDRRFCFFTPLDFFNSVFQNTSCRLLSKLFSEGHILPFRWKAEAPPREAAKYVEFEGASQGWYQDTPSSSEGSNMEQTLWTFEAVRFLFKYIRHRSYSLYTKEPEWKGRTW